MKQTISDSLLVGSGKSKRLDAIRNKARGVVSPIDKKQNQQSMKVGLNQNTTEALQQAEALIDETMQQLMNTYPAGKRNSFFKLKYGVNAEKIKQMSRKQVFTLLKLDNKKVRNFCLIENLDCSGTVITTQK